MLSDVGDAFRVIKRFKVIGYDDGHCPIVSLKRIKIIGLCFGSNTAKMKTTKTESSWFKLMRPMRKKLISSSISSHLCSEDECS